MSNINENDRDLLIRMDERLRAIQAQLTTMLASIASHADKIRALELSDSERKGEARIWGALSGAIVGTIAGAIAAALMKLVLH